MAENQTTSSWRGFTKDTWRAYPYTPSFEAAIIFSAFFGLATIFQIIQIFNAILQKDTTRKRVLYIFLPFFLGGIFETLGYIARVFLSLDVTKFGPYIIQMFLLLLGPVLFAATLYMSLGRLIERMHGQEYSIISLKYSTKIFVKVMLSLSFIAQLAGVGILAGGTPGTGKKIVVGGLIVQLVTFSMFIIVGLVFYYKLTKYPSEIATTTRRYPSKFNNWNSILIVLFFCSVSIFVRSIYRLIEYTQGDDGYLMFHEPFLYCFDAALMFLNMFLFLSQDIGKYYITIGTVKLDASRIEVCELSGTLALQLSALPYKNLRLGRALMSTPN